MAYDREFHRSVSQANINIRRSFDVEVRGVDPDAVQSQYLAFEGARYQFDRTRAAANARSVDQDDYVFAMRNYAEKLAGLASSTEFKAVTSRLMYRQLATPDTPHPKPLAPLFDRSLDRPTVYGAIVLLRDVITEVLVERATSGDLRLSEFLPEQKIAPVMFEVRAGRIVISDKKSEPSIAGATAATVGRAELVERGIEVIRQLEQSNCDRRLVDAVRELQDRLATAENAIRIGLSNLACEVMHKAFEKELPEAISAALQVQTMGVQMYLSQFPDWVQFSKSASENQLGPTTKAAAVAALDRAIAATDGAPDLADPEVPQILKQLKELVTDPNKASRRAVYAAIRSIENLVINVFSYGSSFLHDTIVATSKSVSTTVSRGIAVALLTVGLSVASGLLPITGSVEGLGWLREAIVVVQREMVKFAK